MGWLAKVVASITSFAWCPTSCCGLKHLQTVIFVMRPLALVEDGLHIICCHMFNFLAPLLPLSSQIIHKIVHYHIFYSVWFPHLLCPWHHIWTTTPSPSSTTSWKLRGRAERASTKHKPCSQSSQMPDAPSTQISIYHHCNQSTNWAAIYYVIYSPLLTAMNAPLCSSINSSFLSSIPST